MIIFSISLPKFAPLNWFLSQAKAIPNTVIVRPRHQSTTAFKDAALTGIVRWEPYLVMTVLAAIHSSPQLWNATFAVALRVMFVCRVSEKDGNNNHNYQQDVCPPQPANLIPVELAGNYRTCNPYARTGTPQVGIIRLPNFHSLKVLSREFGLSLHWPRQWIHLLPCAVAEQSTLFNHIKKLYGIKILGYVRVGKKECIDLQIASGRSKFFSKVGILSWITANPCGNRTSAALFTDTQWHQWHQQKAICMHFLQCPFPAQSRRIGQCATS